jgi:hypothetical protein
MSGAHVTFERFADAQPEGSPFHRYMYEPDPPVAFVEKFTSWPTSTDLAGDANGVDAEGPAPTVKLRAPLAERYPFLSVTSTDTV